jgi:hypothetical protein
MKSLVKIITQLGVIWLIVFGFAGLQAAWAASNISTTYKYAWSENVGWQNWHSTNAQATVGTTYLGGYVWAENIGWIKLGSTPESGTYPNTTSTNWGVNRDSGTGALSGYAWSENVGWINFHPIDSQVVIATSDRKFSGYAWGENVGWIHFENASPEYYVQQSDPLVVKLASFTAEALEDHVLLEWKTASEIYNAGFYLLRSETKDYGYDRITGFIKAEGGPTQGATYTYEDYHVVRGLTYYYQLEDINYDGYGTFHGPVSAALDDEADAIVLIFPEDGALIQGDPPATFEWENADLVRFKLGFSRSPDFTGKVIMLPAGSKRITGESYTPNPREWLKIRPLGRTVYWAVYGEDKAGKGVVSKTFGFRINDRRLKN